MQAQAVPWNSIPAAWHQVKVHLALAKGRQTAQTKCRRHQVSDPALVKHSELLLAVRASVTPQLETAARTSCKESLLPVQSLMNLPDTIYTFGFLQHPLIPRSAVQSHFA